jgi:hypothetical protein
LPLGLAAGIESALTYSTPLTEMEDSSAEVMRKERWGMRQDKNRAGLLPCQASTGGR